VDVLVDSDSDVDSDTDDDPLARRLHVNQSWPVVRIGQTNAGSQHSLLVAVSDGISCNSFHSVSLHAFVLLRLAVHGRSLDSESGQSDVPLHVVGNCWSLPTLWQLCKRVGLPPPRLWPTELTPSLMLAWSSNPKNVATLHAIAYPERFRIEELKSLSQGSSPQIPVAPTEQEQVVASALAYAAGWSTKAAGALPDVAAASCARMLSMAVEATQSLGGFYLSGLHQWKTKTAESSAWTARDDNPRTAYDWCMCDGPNAPWMTLPPLVLLQAATGSQLPVESSTSDEAAVAGSGSQRSSSRSDP